MARCPVANALRQGLGSGYDDDFAKSGYVYAIQDERDRFKSEGVHTPYEDWLHDGYDTVEWLAVQPWSTGKIGLSRTSALGIAANLAAAANPPHLVAAYVVIAHQKKTLSLPARLTLNSSPLPTASRVNGVRSGQVHFPTKIRAHINQGKALGSTRLQV